MDRKGLTLVEMLVAVAITLLLAVVLYGVYAAAAAKGRFMTACGFGGAVKVALERALQGTLNRTPEDLPQSLGLPQADPPPGLSGGTYYDCGRPTSLWAAPPAYTACRVEVSAQGVGNALGGQSLLERVAVYTWVRGRQDLCLNGARP